MKRLLILLLAVLVAIACTTRGGADEHETVAVVTVTAAGQSATLSAEDSAVVMAALDGRGWINDQYKCESDVRVSCDGRSYYYHSECGSFNDPAGKRGLKLSDEAQEQLNTMFARYVTLGGIL